MILHLPSILCKIVGKKKNRLFFLLENEKVAIFAFINKRRKQTMSIKIRLQQSKFTAPGQGGKWHARTVSTGVVETDDLARNIAADTSFARGDVSGLIDALVDEITMQLREGKTIAIRGLGRFHLTVESNTVDDPDDFDIYDDIKRVKCKFLPSTSKDPDTGKKEDNFGYGVMVRWHDSDDHTK